MIPGKRGFALLPVLIILASVLIGTGSVLVLRERIEEQETSLSTEQVGIKVQEEEKIEDFSSPQMREGAEEQSDEAEGLNENDDANVKLQISNDESNSNSNNNLSTLNFQLSTKDSIYLEGDNDGKDELNLGKTLKIKGGEGIKTSLDNNTITITNTGNTSPSSTVTVSESTTYDFDSTQFNVSDNDVSIKDIYVKKTDGVLANGSNISLLNNDSGYITDGNTGWDNSYGFITDGNTGWDNSYGYITDSSSDALTNKTGNISQWTNDSNYITDGNTNWNNSYGFITEGNDGWDNTYGFITDGNTGWDNSYGYITASSNDALTNKTGNISQWTNDSNYITDGNTNWDNSYGFITDGNTGWDNSYGFITDGNSGWDNSYNFITTSNVSGTTNYISKFTGTNTVGNSLLFDSGTNLGIGTTDPQKKLEINDNDSDTTTSGLRFGNFVCSGSDKLTVDVNGDVVCATDQTGSGTGNIIDTLSDTLSAGNNANSLNITNVGRLYTAIGLVGTPSFSFQSDQDTGMWSSGADTLNFSTGGAERMRISSTGAITGGTYNSTTLSGGTLSSTAVNGVTTANILTTGSSFSGDVSGAYNSIAVTDDSHNHTSSTISGIDISSDTNLSGDTEIVLTGDALSLASSITRDSEIASFITDGNTGWDNSYGFITDGNSGWDNSYGFITASSSDALTNKTGNISMWTNDSGYITDGNTNWDNSYGYITDGNTGWDNSYGYITSVDFSQINNGSGIYLNYKPNNTACGLNQVLKYDTVNNRWICGDDIDTDTDTDTDTNNYPTGLAFSGTTTKTLTLQRQGLADLTATFTDIDTDTNTTYSAGTGLSLGGTTFSIDSTYDDNFLTTSSTFGGDVSGTYNSIAVTDDSHSHTASTIPSHDSITGAGTVDTTLEVQGVSVGGDASGSVGTIAVTDDSHNHTSSTLSGIDISSDTNLSGDTEIVLTGDALSLASSITRDSEIASFITASSSDALSNKTGNISMWTNDSGYITDGNTNWDNSYGYITDGNSGWDNSYGFITSVDFSQINNGSGIYLNYKPNNTACGLNQVLKYDNVNNRWICGDDIDTDTDTDTDTNNYPTGLAFSGTTTKTLTLQRQGLADITAQFTDIDTDTNTTYSAGTGLSLVDTTFSVADSMATDSEVSLALGNYLPLAGGALTGTLGLPSSGYLNFASTDGESGYGVRDNSGTIQVKNSGGDWSNIPTSGTTQWTTSGSNIYYNSGGVGIGTTAPAGKLTVYSNAIGAPATSGSSDPNVINRILGGSVALDTGSYSTGTAWIQNRLASNLATNYNLALQPNGGNVGIGTSLPGSKLDIGGPTGSQYGTLSIKESGSGKGLWIQSFENNNAIEMYHTGSLGVISTDYTISGSHSPLNIQRTGGNVGIGLDSPAYKLDVAGTMNAQEVRVNGVVLSPGTGSNWTVSGGNVYRASGNVGIGTASPAKPFDVRSSATGHDMQLISTDSEASMRFENDARAFAVGTRDLGTGADSFFVYDNTASADRFTISSSGNVGIGTTSPGAKLDNNGILSLRGTANSGGILPAVQLLQTSGIGLHLGYDSVNDSGVIRSEFPGTAMKSLLIGGSPIRYFVSANEVMRIATSGNVGIGTTNPVNLFSLYNSIAPGFSMQNSVSGSANSSDGFAIYQGDGGVGAGVAIWQYEDSYIRIGTNGAERIRINNAGNVGIGTTNPLPATDSSSHTLQIGNEFIMQNVVGNQLLLSNNAYIDSTWKYATTDTAQAIRMYGGDIIFHLAPSGTAGSTISNWDALANKPMIIKNSGNVGINTVSPSYKLHVDGSFNATSVYSNGVLLSPGTGSNWTVSGSNIYRSAGNVGIGNTFPYYGKLSVEADIGQTSSALGTIEIRTPSGNATADATVGFHIPGQVGIQVGIDNDDNVFKIGGWSYPENILAITASGTVGIGKSNPDHILDILQSVNGESGITVKNSNTGASAYSIIRLQNDGGKQISMFLNGSNKTGDGGVNAATIRTESTAGNLYLGAGGASFMTLSTGGNVGIGTTAPNYKIDVSDNSSTFAMKITNTGSTGNPGGLYIVPGTDGAQALTVNNAANSISRHLFYGTGNAILANGAGNVGIGTTSPIRNLHINAAAAEASIVLSRADGLADNKNWRIFSQNNGAGTAGFLTFDLLNDAGSASSRNVMNLVSSGNVGIGTTNPAYALEVSSTATTQLSVRNTSSTGFANIMALNNVGTGFQIGQQGTEVSGGTRGSILENGTEIMTFLTSGNVGVGATAPAYKLDVNGSLNATSVYSNGVLLSPGTGSNWSVNGSNIYRSAGNVGIGITNPSALFHSYLSGSGSGDREVAKFGSNGGNPYISVMGGANGGYLLYDNTNNRLRIGVHGSNGPTIDNAGNVGIGTTNPSVKLNVVGSVGSTLARFTDGLNGTLDVRTPAFNQTDLFANSTSMTLTTQAGETMRLSGGNLGIGTTNPGNKLTVQQNDNTKYQLRLQTSQADSNNQYYDLGVDTADGYFVMNGAQSGFVGYKWYINGSEKMRINSSGNVGIGTVSPSYKLDVNGSFNATSVYSNGVLLSPGTGSNWTVSGSNIYRSSGNVGIGGASPNSPLSINKSTVSAGSMISMESDLHTANGNYSMIQWGDNSQPSLYHKGAIIYENRDGINSYARGNMHIALNSATDSSNVTIADAKLTVQYNGNVGIGTTTPNEKLEVSGAVKVTGQSVDWGYNASFFDRASTTDTRIAAGASAGASSNILFYTYNAGTNGERLRITNSGNVGIGTTAPTNKLSVTGSVDLTGSLGIGTTAPVGKLNVYHGTVGAPATSGSSDSTIAGRISNDTSGLDFGAYNGGTSWIQNRAIADFSTNYNLALQPNGGNVGIGTTAPAYKLEVLAANVDGIRITSPQSTVLRIDSTNSNENNRNWSINSNDIIFGDLNIRTSLTNGGNPLLGNSRLYINSNGSVGIGTTSVTSGNSLQVNGPIASTSFWTTNDRQAGLNSFNTNGLTFRAGNVDDRMVINASGNVGIGTTNPSYKLDTRTASGSDSVSVSQGGNLAVRMMTGSTYSGIFFQNSGYSHGKLVSDGSNFIFRNSSGSNDIDNTGNPAFLTINSNGIYVTGNGYKPGGGSWSDSSDSRLKKEVTPVTDALSKIMQLNPVQFKWKNPEEHGNQTGIQGGFIAQEIQSLFPGWVSEVDPQGDDADLVDGKALALQLPFEFNALIVKGMKEQQEEINSIDIKVVSVEDQIAELNNEWVINNGESEIESLKARVAALENSNTNDNTSITNENLNENLNDNSSVSPAVVIPEADKTVSNTNANTNDNLNLDKEINDKLSILGISNVGDTVLGFFKEAWFSMEATFEKAVVFLGEVTFSGVAKFEKPIELSQDSVGQAVIKAGETETTIPFSEPYTQKPIVNLTPVGLNQVFYGAEPVLDEATKQYTGFKILISEKQEKDVEFSWQAFGQNSEDE